jgi:hypothetical protein
MDSPYYSKSELCGVAVMVSSWSTSLAKWCTSYNAPPTPWKHAADHLSLQNCLPQSSLFMAGKAQKSHGVRCGLCGRCSDGVPLIHFFQAEHRIQFRSHPMWFLGFFKHEKGAPRHEISKWSMVCSMFSKSGQSFVRNALLTKGGTSKKRLSSHLHKVLTWVMRWVHELANGPRTCTLEHNNKVMVLI